MLRPLFFFAAVILFLIAAFGAFGAFSGINYDGLVAIGFACITVAVFDFEDLLLSRRKR
jgi:hypothetical protein